MQRRKSLFIYNWTRNITSDDCQLSVNEKDGDPPSGSGDCIGTRPSRRDLNLIYTTFNNRLVSDSGNTKMILDNWYLTLLGIQIERTVHTGFIDCELTKWLVGYFMPVNDWDPVNVF